jgi:hypothetical protein
MQMLTHQMGRAVVMEEQTIETLVGDLVADGKIQTLLI